MHKLIVPIITAVLLVSCSGGDVTYTRCEEKCEYSRRDCVQDCGGYDRAGFSFNYGENVPFKPFSCTERCEEKAEHCKKRCSIEKQ